MSFRLNFDLSFNFPPPPPRGQRPLLASDDSGNTSSEEIKTGFPGWLQTARVHPRFSLRLLYFLSAVAGIILDNLVVNNVWHYYRVVDIHQMAFAPLIIGLLWQLITIYDKRLFRGRQLPNWAIAIVETLGFLAFLALFVGNRIALTDRSEYFALGEMLLIAYDSAVWIILCCHDCERAHGKGKGHATDAEDEEEALFSGEGPACEEGQAGSSEQIAPTKYRDEVEGHEIS
ncbi:MAG: hypothetical protein Q9169_008429 [Polycauliona sp. 2 TL-2023]